MAGESIYVRVRVKGVTQAIDAARIVIAAGTIESTKLLQRSVSPLWPRGIGNDNGLVGRFLVTHPYFIFKGKTKANKLRLQKEMDFPTLVSRHFDSEREQQAGKFILVSPPDTFDPKLVSLMKKGNTRAMLDQTLIGPQTVSLHGMIEVFGRPKNRVSNAPDKNRMGLLQTIVDYTKDDGFDSRMDRIQGHVEEIFGKMDVTGAGKPTVSWRADHAGSTCRMGTDPATSVVDPDLRVHGIDNLYVCSNSTFPTIGAINPTLTLTALALRLGDYLVARSAKGTP